MPVGLVSSGQGMAPQLWEVGRRGGWVGWSQLGSERREVAAPRPGTWVVDKRHGITSRVGICRPVDWASGPCCLGAQAGGLVSTSRLRRVRSYRMIGSSPARDFLQFQCN